MPCTRNKIAEFIISYLFNLTTKSTVKGVLIAYLLILINSISFVLLLRAILCSVCLSLAVAVVVVAAFFGFVLFFVFRVATRNVNISSHLR